MSEFVTINSRDPIEKQAADWMRLEQKKLERSVVIEFTPKLASWLLQNRSDPAKNRRLSSDRVARYASDMAAGRWVLNGETVKIGAAGVLIDAHHRMSACVRAGKPFSSHVVFGIEPPAMRTVDQGKSRTLEDVFRINAGLPPDTAKAARLVRLLERPDPKARESGLRELTNAVEVLDWYQANRTRFERTEWMLKPIRTGLRLRNPRPVAAHVMYAVALMAWEKSPQRVAAMLQEFAAGIMPKGSPLLKALMVLSAARERSGGRLHEALILNALRVAFDFIAQGQHGNQKAMKVWKPGHGIA